MGHAGVKPWWRHRRTTPAKTGPADHDTPRRGKQDGGLDLATVIVSRQREQFGDGQLDVSTAAVVLTIVGRDWQRPNGIVPARRHARPGFDRGVLVPSAKAKHRHTARSAESSVERKDRGEQDGEWHEQQG